MSTFPSSNYEPLLTTEDDEEEEISELPPTFVTTRGPEKNNGRWNHIENLDDFFTRIYKYHRAQGFVCLLLTNVSVLLQYVFIVIFGVFLAVCVDYEILFKDEHPTYSKVIEWAKFQHIPGGLVLCMVVAFLFWMIRLVQVIYDIWKAWELHQFFKQVLCMDDNDLQNMTWQDVQTKLIEVQSSHQMCIHKKELTELDIHHRILRQKNYLIALQNKGVIDYLFTFPFLGKRSFLTEGLKFNLYLILFNGPGAPFEKSWKLKTGYKDISNRTMLASQMSQRIFILGIVNFVFCPFIMLYQFLYSFFTYAELVKRSPDLFGARKWSLYGRVYLRHFNELDHEFQQRLSRAYDPSRKYINSFMAPILTIVAKNIAFFAGSMLAVMLALSFYDQDVLTAEHAISFMASLGIIIKVCTGLIPDENIIYNPETLMKQILLICHYIPDYWKGKAHTLHVREEFSRLFQYKFVYLLEELLSPLLAPFLLCFSIRYKAQQIVDFYRNFTVEVTGVGDVCSFAQMDVRRHGHKMWMSGHTDQENQNEIFDNVEKQAEHGKTELSLLHFSIKNPTWQPTDSGKQYLESVREHALQESLVTSQHPTTLQRQPSNYSSMGNEYITTFIGLQSLGYPSLEPCGSVIPEQEDVLLNASMMYAHGMHDRQQNSFPGSSSTHHQQQQSQQRSQRQSSDQTTQGAPREWIPPSNCGSSNYDEDNHL